MWTCAEHLFTAGRSFLRNSKRESSAASCRARGTRRPSDVCRCPSSWRGGHRGQGRQKPIRGRPARDVALAEDQESRLPASGEGRISSAKGSLAPLSKLLPDPIPREKYRNKQMRSVGALEPQTIVL